MLGKETHTIFLYFYYSPNGPKWLYPLVTHTHTLSLSLTHTLSLSLPACLLITDSSPTGTQDIVLDFLPGISTSRLGNVPVETLKTKDLTHPFFQIIVQSFLRGAESQRVLVNSFDGVEAGAMEALRAKNVKMTPIGPTFGVGHKKDSPSLLDEAQSKCLQWLDKQAPKSVVYVAFGSAGFLSREEMRELVAALEAFGRPFLWAIRDGSATESLPVSFRAGNLPRKAS